MIEYFSLMMTHIVPKHVGEYNNVHMCIVNKVLEGCLSSLITNSSDSMSFNTLIQQAKLPTKEQTKEILEFA
jgi:hypothetical protein